MNTLTKIALSSCNICMPIFTTLLLRKAVEYFFCKRQKISVGETTMASSL